MQTTTNIELLEKGSLSAVFRKYAIPSIVTLVFFGFQNIIDGIIVGNYVGADALGGVNIILPFYSMVMVVAMIVGIGSQTLVSMSVGEQNLSKAQDAMSTGFWSLLCLGILMTIVLYFLGDSFAALLGADERLLPHASNYLKGLTPFLAFITLSFYSDSMLKATGHPQYSMIIMSGTILLNILLSLLFIIYFEMGTMGASIATGLAFTIGLVATGFIIFNPRRPLSMLKGKFRRSLLYQAFYNGSSEGVSELASSVTILLVNLTVVKLVGADGVAAFTAINYINFTGVLIFLGISDGLIPVMSHNYGAKNYERVKSIVRFTARINVILGVLVFIVLQLFGGEIVKLFFNADSQVAVEVATNGLLIYAFVFLFNGLNILATSFFTAIGDAKQSIIIAVTRGLVFIAAGVTILPRFMGIDGVWATMPIAEFLTLGISFWLYRKVMLRFG